MSPPVVVLLRHGEKPDPKAGIQGVDERGRALPEGLSPPGWQRAGALVRLLVPLAPDAAWLPRPTALWAARATGRHPSRRPLLTLLPLAAELRLAVDQSASADDPPESVAARLASLSGVTVVCWRHDDLPALARALCPQADVPALWPEDRFDVLWVVEGEGDGRHFRALPQRLLAGDGATPF